MSWDPEFIWVEPGPLQTVFLWTALPAFVVTAGVLHVADKFAINQVPVFLALLPVSVAAWFYMIGWLIDRWRFRRRLRAQAA